MKYFVLTIFEMKQNSTFGNDKKDGYCDDLVADHPAHDKKQIVIQRQKIL